MEKKKEKEIELTRGQKTRLLKLGLSDSRVEDADDSVDAWRDRLYEVITHPLPLADVRAGNLPAALQSLSHELVSVAGQSIDRLLESADTDITVLNRVRIFAKENGTTAGSERDRDVYMAIYLAAIASALVFHGQKISGHAESLLEEFFSEYIEKPWVLSELRELLKKAKYQIRAEG